jgi:hypothetical protein
MNEQVLPAGLKVEVTRYTKTVFGGCDKAEIEVTGEPERLLELINYLRDGVEIYDGNGNPIWWGYVQRVEIPHEKVMVVVDLDEMSNQVAIAYNLISAGGNTIGIRGTSPWIIDEDSIAKYGIKELLESGGSMNAVEALSMATRLRNELSFPRAYVVSSQQITARIECYGWWHTLGWRYCYVPTELALSFQTIGNAAVALFDGVKIAQSFIASSDINLAEVGIHVRKIGGPGDINIALCKVDPDGLPGDNIRSATINAALISSTTGWVKAPFTETVLLTPGEKYFLTLESAWSTESSYQIVTLDPNNGYGGGKYFKLVDNVWVETAKDMPFRLYNNVLTETSQQLQNYLTDSGQFFSQVIVNDRSGLYAESYRNGDTTAITEAEDLLAIGTSDYLRLLARVNPDRSVEVWKEPEEPLNPAVEIRSDNKLYYRTGAPVEENFDPTGKWISIEPIIWGIAENTTLLGTKNFFCDGMEWTRENGVQMKPANWKNPLNLRITNG